MTDHAQLQTLAKRHLLMHFTRQSAYETDEVPVISHGEHCSVYDTNGKKYFDALSGLFCTQIGYSFGAELGEAAAKQMAELPFYTNWNYAHPRSVELAGKVAELAPGDLNRIFFVSGGSEANEAIIKLVKQFHQFKGFRNRYKMIARRIAYHGTTYGALSLTGVAPLRTPFEPLMPGVRHVSNTNSYRRPQGETEAEFTQFLLDELRAQIEQETPETVAAVFIEPVQNSGGTFTPPEGYCRGVREICDEYGILLVADEVICGFGRLGYWFGSERYDIRPDIITFAKGIGSAHVPLGGVLMTDAVAAPVHRGHEHVQPRHHLRRSSRLVRRGAQEPRGDGARGRARERPPERGLLPRHPEQARREADRRRRARRRVLHVARAGEGQGDQGDVHRRRGRVPAAWVPVAARCTTPA